MMFTKTLVLAALVAGVFGDKDIESDDLIDTDQGKSLVLDHQRGLRTGGACAGVFLFFLLVMAVRNHYAQKAADAAQAILDEEDKMRRMGSAYMPPKSKSGVQNV